MKLQPRQWTADCQVIKEGRAMSEKQTFLGFNAPNLEIQKILSLKQLIILNIAQNTKLGKSKVKL